MKLLRLLACSDPSTSSDSPESYSDQQQSECQSNTKEMFTSQHKCLVSETPEQPSSTGVHRQVYKPPKAQ
jgi:hypothetical protein